MIGRIGFFVIGAALLAGAPAAAATLTSDFVYSSDSDSINCNLVNAGKKAITVVFRIRNIAGEILEESGAIPIPPQQANGIGDGPNEDYFGFCEFEFKGKAKQVRASLQLKVSGSAPTVVVPAR